MENEMKKLSLAIIIVMFSMSLVACKNSAGTNINNVPGTNTSIDSEITIDKAKEIALEHAGLIESKVSFIKAEKDIDAGVGKYEVEFYCDGKEYDYEISAIDGSIIKYDHEIENGNNVNNGASNTQGNISVDEANRLNVLAREVYSVEHVCFGLVFLNLLEDNLLCISLIGYPPFVNLEKLMMIAYS